MWIKLIKITDYDFSKLNDREFEILAASVIAKEQNIKVEIFKSGKDGGVDGRFWIEVKKEGIIQCKCSLHNDEYKSNKGNYTIG
ncbi:restriction endonuclease [Arenibacter sp. GZD-96]|uniref:restriction endonuclease n=1 Tax=Aurantibrevibacter litoralis TaxID=3106030 RepID=UPI003A4DE1F0